MSKTPNLYQILGIKQSVCKEPNCDELIKKAYYKRALVSHPDKNKDNEIAGELFELLTSAYEILKDPETRAAYNQKLKGTYKDHEGLKKRYDKYAKTLPEPTDQKFSDFGPVLPKDTLSTNERLAQIQSIRAEQDAFVPKKLFQEKAFDPRVFNAYCDKYDSIASSNNQLQQFSHPKAWDSDSSLFGTFSLESTDIDLTQDMEELGQADYYSNHNVKDENYYADIKKRLLERQRMTETIEKDRAGTLDSPYDTVIAEAFDQDDAFPSITQINEKLSLLANKN